MHRYARVKSALRVLGLYPSVRYWYRRIKPDLREERERERRFYEQFVNAGDLCFDVGANVGQTLEAMLACKGRVIAIEPNPFCVQALAWEFGKNPDVTIVDKAIGATNGFAELHFDGTDSTGSLRADWPFPARQVRQVPVTTLDDLIAQFGRPKVCKVDVEGFELEVFRGLSQPIPIVRFEFHKRELQRGLDCLARLEQIGQIQSANLTNELGTHFLSEEWMSAQALRERMVGLDAARGDIVVRMGEG
jgi:FkbM family methyltransferase